MFHKNGEIEIINGPTIFYEDQLKHSNIEKCKSLFIEPNHKMRVQTIQQTTSKVLFDTVLEGPCYYTPQINDKYYNLTFHKATTDEYIKVTNTNGKVFILMGPCTFYEDKSEHTDVTILKRQWLDKYQKIRVRKLDSKHNTVLDDTILDNSGYITPHIDELYSDLSLINVAANEYIKIKYKNGTTEIKVGPMTFYKDPIEHSEIIMEKVIVLESNECIIIYRPKDATNLEDLERIKIMGPCTYIPQINDTIHEFLWHGHNPKESEATVGKNIKIPNAIKFKKIVLVPRQMYLDIPTVSTKDNAQLTICFMIFYELTDVEKMLDTTTDPIGDIVNFHTSDVITFINKLTFDEVKFNSDKLNGLELYKNLVQAMKDRGYNITNVVLRGIITNNKLQNMYEHAIETRTALILEHETEKEKQAILDLKAQKNRERLLIENETNKIKVENDINIKQIQHEYSLKEKHELYELEVGHKKNLDNLAIETRNKENLNKINYYKSLSDLGTDLTKIITEENLSATPVGKMIRVISPDGLPNLKLIESKE